jgi:hypothetical protein
MRHFSEIDVRTNLFFYKWYCLFEQIRKSGASGLESPDSGIWNPYWNSGLRPLTLPYVERP